MNKTEWHLESDTFFSSVGNVKTNCKFMWTDSMAETITSYYLQNGNLLFCGSNQILSSHGKYSSFRIPFKCQSMWFCLQMHSITIKQATCWNSFTNARFDYLVEWVLFEIQAFKPLGIHSISSISFAAPCRTLPHSDME